MMYFNIKNEALLPMIIYDNKYVLYSIDVYNKTVGLDFYSLAGIKKYYSEALNEAFESLGMNKVYVNVVRDDFLTYDTLKKLNFIMEAIHRNGYADEKYHDIIYMTVTKNEWKNKGVESGYSYKTYSKESLGD